MWKTGHSLIKAKMKEIGAPLAGEMSGHIFFNERWYGFDDAHLHRRRACSRSCRASDDPSAVLERAAHQLLSTPELNVPCAEGEPHARGRRAASRSASFAGAGAGHHHRRRARRLRRRLRPDPRLQHHAGAGAALRGPHRRRRCSASSATCWRCCGASSPTRRSQRRRID